jgi:hypothetical protein
MLKIHLLEMRILSYYSAILVRKQGKEVGGA